MARLQPGMRFRMIEGGPTVYEVVRVTPCSAVCRSTDKRHVEIRDDEGDVKAAFDAPGRPFMISPNSFVEVVE